MGADSKRGHTVATQVEQHASRSIELALYELDQCHWLVVTPQGANTGVLSRRASNSGFIDRTVSIGIRHINLKLEQESVSSIVTAA
ncbi:MAG: hypothetical protein ABI140_01885 [Jatrophihabitantaceae bacterium]